MSKIKTVVVFTAGYIVGARAGRGRYEQIKRWAKETWGRPIVQEQVEKASEQVSRVGQEVKQHLPGARNDSAEGPEEGFRADPGGGEYRG